MSERDVSRRSALRYFGLLTATAVGREFLASWLPLPVGHAAGSDDLVTIHGATHSHADRDYETPATRYVAQFFKGDQFKIVETLTEMIIPTDDQPGAKQAQVANYIDFVVLSAREFQPSLQKEWREGLAYLERESQKRFGKSFHVASEPDRTQLLTDMSLPERDPKAQHEGYAFFQVVKEMTVEGFYTSRIGLIDVLDYQGMNYNGDFPGCTHPEHQS